jgi:hypothetical protein
MKLPLASVVGSIHNAYALAAFALLLVYILLTDAQ